MTLLTAVVAVFLFVETANVAALYFNTGSHRFNALGVFRAWESSKTDPDVHDLVRYLAYWVAGTKLISLLLLLTILVYGDDRMKVIATAATAIAIVTYYWRLAPLARGIDGRSQLTVPGYSRVLTFMVSGLLAALVIGVAVGASTL